MHTHAHIRKRLIYRLRSHLSVEYYDSMPMHSFHKAHVQYILHVITSYKKNWGCPKLSSGTCALLKASVVERNALRVAHT